MKKKEFKELKNKEVKDLNKLVEERRGKLRKLLVDIKNGSEKNVKKAGVLKDETAKILTLLREREIVDNLKTNKDKKEEQK